MYISVFLIPFFIYLNIAAQLNALVIFCILIPGYYYQHYLAKEDLNKFRNLGLLLTALWLTSPIWNIIHAVFSSNHDKNVPLKQLFKSHIPSGVLISGTGLIVLYLLSLRSDKNKINSPSLNKKLYLKKLNSGFFYTGIFIFLVATFQTFTGFRFTSLNSSMDLSFSRIYRVSLFSSHTLISASIALFIFSFFILLYYKIEIMTKNQKNIFKHAPLTMIFVNLVILVLNQSRTTLMLTIITALIISTFYLFKHWKSNTKSFLVLLAGFSVVIVFTYNIIEKDRLYQLLHLSEDQTIKELVIQNPRFAIWKGHINMFLDSPLFGYGYAFITDDLKSKFFDLSNFQAHNSYLQLLVDMGLVGSALVISILAYCLYIFWKMMNENGLTYSPILIRCFFFALFTNAMHALTQNNLFESSTVTVYLIVAWIIMWLRVQEKNEEKLLC